MGLRFAFFRHACMEVERGFWHKANTDYLSGTYTARPGVPIDWRLSRSHAWSIASLRRRDKGGIMHGSGSVQGSRRRAVARRALSSIGTGYWPRAARRRPPPSSTIAEVEGEEEASGFRGPTHPHRMTHRMTHRLPNDA